MHHDERGGGGKFNGEVAVADGVQAVLAHAGPALFIDHAQRAGDAFAVERVGCARQGGAAQGQLVHALSDVLHAGFVAGEHFDVGQQVVGEADGLGHLQVGKAGEDGVYVALGHADERGLQVAQKAADEVDFAAQPQADVGGDLVVAAAAGVQALAGVAHELGQARFDVQVHVFQRQLPFELAGFDFAADLRHALLDGGQIGGADDALCGQHAGVGQAAGDVGFGQALVKKDAGGVALHQLAHGFGKQGGPGLGFLVELVAHGLSGKKAG